MWTFTRHARRASPLDLGWGVRWQFGVRNPKNRVRPSVYWTICWIETGILLAGGRCSMLRLPLKTLRLAYFYCVGSYGCDVH